MASLDELKAAARLEARQKMQDEQKALAQQENQQLKSLEGLPKEEAVPTGKIPDAGALMGQLQKDVARKEAPAKATESIKRVARGFDDMARVATGSVGNALASAMSDSTLQEEALRTANSKESLGGLAGPTAAVGAVGMGLALPGGMFATPMRAAGSSGAIGTLDTLFDRMEQGKPLHTQDALEDMAASGASSAVAGTLGYHLGKGLSSLVSRFMGRDPSLSGTIARAVDANKKVSNEASKVMEGSGVVITGNALNRLVMRTNQKLRKLEFSPRTSRNAWNAMNNILGARAGRGDDIPLENFNALRKQIRDSVRSARTGELLDTVNDNDMKAMRVIINEMNDFITTLPQRTNAVRAGDVQRGVDGWNKMNRYFEKQARTDVLSDLIKKAEFDAKSGRKAIDVALKDEFSSLFRTKAGRETLEREFSAGQKKMLERIAMGDFSERTLTRLDRMVGGGFLLKFMFNTLRSGHSAMFEAEASRYMTRKAINNIAELPMSVPMAPQAGAVGMQQADQGRPPMSTPQPMPKGGGSSAPQQAPGGSLGQRMPRPLTPQSQSAVPSLPKPPA